MSFSRVSGINPATQSYIDYLIQKRQDRYADLRQRRDYADGKQQDYLTDGMRKLLVGTDGAGNPNTAPEVVINVCEPILDAEADRLQVKGFTVTVADNEALSETLTERAWSIWKKSRMDEGQMSVHYCACRDADSYLITWFDPTENEQESRLTFNRQYDGETAGVDMLYTDDDPTMPIAAVKIWTVERPVVGNSKTGRTQRKNVYYHNRVEKYINTSATGSFASAKWRPLADGDPGWDDELQPAQLTDVYGNTYTAMVMWLTTDGTPDGDALGLPVFHFRHQARGEALGRSTLAPIVPGVQDAINMSGLSLLAAEQLSGFKVTFATKFDPKESEIKIAPGGIVYNLEDGTFGQLGETNLIQLQDTLNTWIKIAATLTKTPLTFFNQTGQMPAEGTLRQQEISLVAKTRTNQTAFGNAYEDAIRYAFKLEAVHGNDLGVDLATVDDLEIVCEWESAVLRNERDDTELALMRLTQHAIPLAQAQREMGYSPEQIATFETAMDVRRNQAMASLAQRVAETDAANRAVAAMQSGNGASENADPNAATN
jgi:hypothetical protein